MKATTTGEVVAHLLGGTSLRDAAASPPDVFCVAAALSELSGAYLNITDRHFVLHPSGIAAGDWEQHARKVGEAWRSAVVGLGNKTSLSISAGKMPPEAWRAISGLLPVRPCHRNPTHDAVGSEVEPMGTARNATFPTLNP